MRNKHEAQRIMAKFINYMRETWKIKLAAIGFTCIGLAPYILDGDATALVIIGMFTVPAFFMNKPCDDED